MHIHLALLCVRVISKSCKNRTFSITRLISHKWQPNLALVFFTHLFCAVVALCIWWMAGFIVDWLRRAFLRRCCQPCFDACQLHTVVVDCVWSGSLVAMCRRHWPHSTSSSDTDLTALVAMCHTDTDLTALVAMCHRHWPHSTSSYVCRVTYSQSSWSVMSCRTSCVPSSTGWIWTPTFSSCRTNSFRCDPRTSFISLLSLHVDKFVDWCYCRD